MPHQQASPALVEPGDLNIPLRYPLADALHQFTTGIKAVVGEPDRTPAVPLDDQFQFLNDRLGIAGSPSSAAIPRVSRPPRPARRRLPQGRSAASPRPGQATHPHDAPSLGCVNKSRSDHTLSSWCSRPVSRKYTSARQNPANVYLTSASFCATLPVRGEHWRSADPDAQDRGEPVVTLCVALGEHRHLHR